MKSQTASTKEAAKSNNKNGRSKIVTSTFGIVVFFGSGFDIRPIVSLTALSLPDISVSLSLASSGRYIFVISVSVFSSIYVSPIFLKKSSLNERENLHVPRLFRTGYPQRICLCLDSDVSSCIASSSNHFSTGVVLTPHYYILSEHFYVLLYSLGFLNIV